MVTTYSPSKRIKRSVASRVATTAAAVLTTEPALIANIIQFLPPTTNDAPKSNKEEGEDDRDAEEVEEPEEHEEHASEDEDGDEDDEEDEGENEPFMEDAEEAERRQRRVHVLQTISVLCRAIPGLSNLVGPTNQAFWRVLVLEHFDFTVGNETFNVADYHDDCDRGLYEMGWLDPREVETPSMSGYMLSRFRRECGRMDCSLEDVYHAWCQHPVKPSIDAHVVKHGTALPDKILTESLSQWEAMVAYYRPSQYGFLTEIQRDRTKFATLWPEHEDAFSLFCDSVLLQRPHGPWVQGFQTHTDGNGDLTPCLLSRLDCNISERGFELLEHCGYLPHFWCNGNGYSPIVRKRWTGFERPPPAIPDGCRRMDATMNHYATQEELHNFPRAHHGADVVALRQLVYESFTDFRRLLVNPQEHCSPFTLARANDPDAGSGSLVRATTRTATNFTEIPTGIDSSTLATAYCVGSPLLFALDPYCVILPSVVLLPLPLLLVSPCKDTRRAGSILPSVALLSLVLLLVSAWTITSSSATWNSGRHGSNRGREVYR